MPLLHVASPSHDVKVEFGAPNRATVTLGKAGSPDVKGAGGGSGELSHTASAANRNLVLSYQLADTRIETGFLLGQGADENFFLCTVEPPRRVVPAAIPPREYVFVVDVSGSMNGFPLETSKELLRTLLAKLGPHDFFNVLFFSGGTWVLSPTSLAVTESNKAWALQEIERQHGGGGTELLPALRQAFDLPRARADVSRSIVVATDGFVNVEREAFALVRDRLNDASVFAFGIGSSVNRHLIEGLARVGEGEPFIALNAAEARKIALRFLEYIQSPLLTRVEVRASGFDAYDLEPARLPDLFAERPLVLVGKYRGAATGEIVITGFTGEGRFERRIKVDAARTARNDILKVLWARERLALLSDLAIGSGPDAGRRQEVTSLGLKYGLLTEFTSFVAVDQRVRREGGRVETVKQPLPLPEGVSDLAVGGAPGQVQGVAPQSIRLSAPASPVGELRAAKTEAQDSGWQPQRGDNASAHESRMPAPQVELVENRLEGSRQWTADTGRQARVSEAVRRALQTAGCLTTGRAIRLKIVFNARAGVERVEGAGAGLECLRSALQAALKVEGVTGGYVIVRVSWR